MLIKPSYYYDSTFNISPNFLDNMKTKLVLLDIDNTLVTYGDKEPTQIVYDWISKLKENNFIIILTSNNHKSRVEKFNKTLNLPYYYHSFKPLPKCVNKAIKEYNISKENITIIGDQVFTDVLCANFSKVNSILVTPLPYKENLIFKIKRFFEKPIITKFKNTYPDKCFNERSNL